MSQGQVSEQCVIIPACDTQHVPQRFGNVFQCSRCLRYARTADAPMTTGWWRRPEDVGLIRETSETSDDKTAWVSKSGAKRSVKMPRYDLIPRSVLTCLAHRLELGAEKYGEWNWQKALTGGVDTDFSKDSLNHMQHHLSSLSNGDFSEDSAWGHVGAILFGCMMHAEAMTRDEKAGYPAD